MNLLTSGVDVKYLFFWIERKSIILSSFMGTYFFYESKKCRINFMKMEVIPQISGFSYVLHLRWKLFCMTWIIFVDRLTAQTAVKIKIFCNVFKIQRSGTSHVKSEIRPKRIFNSNKTVSYMVLKVWNVFYLSYMQLLLKEWQILNESLSLTLIYYLNILNGTFASVLFKVSENYYTAVHKNEWKTVTKVIIFYSSTHI